MCQPQDHSFSAIIPLTSLDVSHPFCWLIKYAPQKQASGCTIAQLTAWLPLRNILFVSLHFIQQIKTHCEKQKSFLISPSS